MTAPDCILDVYDAPRHLGGRLLGEIREQWLALHAFTSDSREVGSFVKFTDAAIAIDRAMREPVRLRRRVSA